MKYPIVTCITATIWIMCACKQQPSLPDPLHAGWKGQQVCIVLEENPSVRVLKCTFPPGVGHERHYHPPHVAYVLAGSTFQVRDTAGMRQVAMITGDHYFSTGVEWHEALNTGDSTAVFLIIEPR
jgi:quercetin dioxygenase-like cupin family protein